MSTECFVAAWGLIFSTFLIKGGAVTYVTHEPEVLEGDHVEFSCNLTYDPSENFRWIINRGTSSLGILVRPAGSPPEDAYRLNSPFQNRTDISLSGADGTNLTIESVRRTDEAIGEDYYECQQRMGDKDTVRHQLIVQYPPDPPTNLTLTTTSAGLKAICVAGKSKTGSQMICLEYQQHEASKWNKEEPCQPAIRDGRTVQFEVSGLQSMQSYNVCCIASDAYGATATCQNTGPLTMTMTGASLPGWAIAFICVGAIICVGVLLIVVFFIVYCCRKHGKEGNVCHKIPCPCPFGKRGNSGEDIEATGAGKYSLYCCELYCNCCTIAKERTYRLTRQEEDPSAPATPAAIAGSLTRQDATMWADIFQNVTRGGPQLAEKCKDLEVALGLSDEDFEGNNANQSLDGILWTWVNKSTNPTPDILIQALRCDNIRCDALADKLQDFVDSRGRSAPAAPNLGPGTFR